MNGDVCADFQLNEMLTFHRRQDRPILTLMGTEVEITFFQNFWSTNRAFFWHSICVCRLSPLWFGRLVDWLIVQHKNGSPSLIDWLIDWLYNIRMVVHHWLIDWLYNIRMLVYHWLIDCLIKWVFFRPSTLSPLNSAASWKTKPPIKSNITWKNRSPTSALSSTAASTFSPRKSSTLSPALSGAKRTTMYPKISHGSNSLFSKRKIRSCYETLAWHDVEFFSFRLTEDVTRRLSRQRSLSGLSVSETLSLENDVITRLALTGGAFVYYTQGWWSQIKTAG